MQGSVVREHANLETSKIVPGLRVIYLYMLETQHPLAWEHHMAGPAVMGQRNSEWGENQKCESEKTHGLR